MDHQGMVGLALGIFVFATTWCLHVVWWRTSRPQATARALIMLFGGGLALTLAGGPIIAAGLSFDLGTISLLRAILVAGALAAAYIATYPALEAISPTLALLDDIAAAPAPGLSCQALFAAMDDSVLLHPRITDLLNEGLVELVGDRHRLTAKGARVARIFTGLRRLLGLSVGG